MASWEDLSTTLGPVKGKALPLAVEIKIGRGRERHYDPQMEGYLAEKMRGLRLPGLATTTCPSMAS